MEVGTRRIAHRNVTAHPAAAWTLPQFREVITGEQRQRYLIHDRDGIYTSELDTALKAMELRILKTPFQAPQAKGRIERLWGTFQDRLTSELRLAGATDLGAANEVLRRFLPDYNRRFGRAARDAEKAWRPAPKDLDRISCFHHQRSVSNDNVVPWDGRRFQIPPQPQRFSFAGAKVQIHESLEGKIAIYYGENKLDYTEGVTFSSGR